MNFFSSTYDESRTRFTEAAENAGFRLLRFRVPHEDSPELFVDFALLRRDPKRVLLHFSGVHGIEGFAGAAVQVALLQSSFAADGPSLLFVHGVNAYGQAYYRRANGQNVDLNRNYRNGPANPNPDYALFAPFLNPETPAEFRWGKLRALWTSFRLGRARSSQAIASGQVKFPRGLFFMGRHVQREIHFVQELLKSHCSEAEEVVALDFHTGLGRRGEEQLFSDDPEFTDIFEKASVATETYKTQGRFEDAIREALPSALLHYTLQEIGTRCPMQVLEALRAENIEWHRREAGTPRPDAIVSAMMEAFCPADPKWREAVIRLGTERWGQAYSFLEH